VVDAMLVLGKFPRRITVLANAPLFRHPLIGPFLRTIGAVPVIAARRPATTRGRTTRCSPPSSPPCVRGAIPHLSRGRTQPRPTLLPCAGSRAHPARRGDGRTRHGACCCQ
jgi:hypothetical protein